MIDLERYVRAAVMHASAPAICAIALACWLTVAAPVHSASLYQGEGSYRSLTSDKRAYRVGDMLTVLVVENSSASANANTSAEKGGGLTFGMKTSTRSESASLQLGDTFGGKGLAQMGNRFSIFANASYDFDTLTFSRAVFGSNNAFRSFMVFAGARAQF